MSQLKVDSIIPRTGVASGAGGGIVQVVQKVKTSAYAASIGSTEVVPTGMFATITTKTDTSKVLVFVNMTLLVDQSYNGSQWKLRRNSGSDNVTVSGSSNIFVGDADGNRDQATMGMQGPTKSTDGLNGFSCGTQFLDTCGSAGTYTYFVAFRDTVSSDNFFYLNRGYNDSNNQNQPRSTSSITLLEVSA
tara:strand:- start:320 stop:889 length:570 start_codon:yes stop_codon:yes gene_type:complete